MPQSSVAYETIGSRTFAHLSSVDFRRTKALALVFVSPEYETVRKTISGKWTMTSAFPFSFSAATAAAAATNKSILSVGNEGRSLAPLFREITL